MPRRLEDREHPSGSRGSDDTDEGLSPLAVRPPRAGRLRCAATYSGMIAEKDVLVPMRDGVKIAIDVYRPDTTEKLPALLAFSIHNKDLQGPDVAETSLTHPAWSMLWTGPAEAG